MQLHPLIQKQVIQTLGFLPAGHDALSSLLESISNHYYQMEGRSEKGFHFEKDELIQANNELSRKVKELDQFAYIVSHDLKAPLRNISSIITWMEEDYEKEIPEAMKEQFNMVKSRITGMENLIEGILSYSRSGRNLKPEWIVPAEVCNEIVEMIASGKPIKVNIQSNMPAFLGQKTQFVQVMSNLINNAVKHAGEQAEVSIGATSLEGSLQFFVKDNGQGIAPVHHQRIFEMFQSLHDNETKGSGIGLAIVKKIIEGHNGKVWVDSQPGHGAAFYFTWPLLTESENQTKLPHNHE
ncbi:MAG: GHKL domain-containing protein [Bacteroidia bacterium]|nr:GHKL domain-containing protein [Bacteroidia bacterium]